MRFVTVLFAISIYCLPIQCKAQTAEEWRRAAGSTGCGVEGMRNSDSNKELFSDMDSDRDKLKASIESYVEEHDKATKRAAECRDVMNFED
jgi:hypothetical protein